MPEHTFLTPSAVTTPASKAAVLCAAPAPLVQRKCAYGGNSERNENDECEKKKRVLQRKLAIGASNDPLEQEADRVSEQILASPTNLAVSTAKPSIQRYSGQQSRQLQAAPASVERVIGNAGQSLEVALQQDMQQRFGHDFSQVRIHTGSAAEQSARDVNAIAYTVGHNIVFGAGQFAPATTGGRRLIAHELTHVVQQVGSNGTQIAQNNGNGGLAPVAQPNRPVLSLSHGLPVVQRKCHASELGAPNPDCTPSQLGVVGWQLLFKVGCDTLLPGEESKIEKLKPGYHLKIHGFASSEGNADFNRDLSCHRANVVADLVRSQRADCPVVGIFKHGANPVSAPGVVPDANPPDFWRSVIIEQTPPPLESGELWLDPNLKINQGWALLNRAKASPTQSNLDTVAARRGELKVWLESIGKSLAPTNAKLTRTNLNDYRRFYASAEKLWAAIDQLLALQKHSDATKDTYDGWAKGTGTDQGDSIHIKNVPTTAKYHVDIFGEGYFKGAINIGMAERTSTTGVNNSRVPNLIYRKFSSKGANQLPIADHAADLVTSENGPIGMPGLAEEIARIIAPGGTIILNNPASEEVSHDKVAKATGGTVTKVRKNDGVETIETTIVVPGP